MMRITTAIAVGVFAGGLFLSASASDAAQMSAPTPATATGNPGTTVTDPAGDEQLDPQKCMDPRPKVTDTLSNTTKKLSTTCGTIDPNRK